MKRFLQGVALAALSAPAWGQGAFDDPPPIGEDEICVDCGCATTRDELLACSRDFAGNDTVVSVGERIGLARAAELTSPVTVIDPSIRDFGTLADTLRSVPGLSVNSSGSSTGLTQLRLRGAEANHLVVLIDGVEVANPTDGAFDFGGVRTEDVLRVEVLRGEQSALYGSDAIGGVINIVTRASTTTQGWRASVEAGSRNTLEGQVSAGVPLGGATLSINGNAFTTDGYDISGTTGEDDGASSRSINLGLNGVELGSVALSAKYGFIRRDSEFDSDADFDGRLDDVDAETTTDTTTARVEARAPLAGFDILAAVSRAQTETDTRSSFPTLTTGTRDQATLAVERRRDAHNLTVLGEYEREEYAFEGDPDTPSNDTWGLAGDYRYNAGALTLTASARYDSNDLFDDSTTWRLGAGYDTDVFGRIIASLGTGVKNPTLIELFGFFPSANFVGNPDLQPEESLGYNISWSYNLGGGRIAANYFRSELDDEIITIFNPDFTTGVGNLDTDSTREGVEIEGSYRVGDVSLRGSASFLDSDQNGVEEIRRPDFLASGTISWRATDKLSLAVFADHTGKQLDTEFATFSNVELEAFTLVGANVSYAATDHWSIYIRGTNLLDEDYEEVVGYRSPGAALFVGLRADY